MATEKLDLETLSLDEMLDLKDALETKLTEIAKSEAALMTTRLARLKSYLPEYVPAPKSAAKPARSKTLRRKPAKAAAKAKATPKAKTATALKPKARTASAPQPGAKAATARNPTKKTAAAAKPKTKSTTKPRKTSKVSPKYRDPESGKTWSGRGMTPVWLRGYESAGRKRAEFEV